MQLRCPCISRLDFMFEVRNSFWFLVSQLVMRQKKKKERGLGSAVLALG